ncbi:aminodeoxychorismate synthase component I [Marinimicrobium koreense]|jgi:para-aminobenzoate synthetase component 1|uniref:aminodeoxychorismate synthase component I n=1 Tax=Marinimicrobium koreense TaxID=306545 RepID=UPI003F6FBA79
MRPSPRVCSLPYFVDSAHWFACLADWEAPVWLDSGHPGSHYGRFDILAAEPHTQLTGRDAHCDIQRRGQPSERRESPPLDVVRELMPAPLSPLAEIPFATGAIGYFGYDLARRLERLPEQAAADITLPDLWLGFYDWAVVQDHQTAQAYLVTRPEQDIEPLRARLLAREPEKALENFLEETGNRFNINAFKAELSAYSYHKKLNRILDYIHAGDCYQINLAQRFHADYQGNPARAFLALRQALPSPFSGFIPLADGAVISLSPERFIALHDGQAETRPIKGTAPRRSDPEADRAEAQALAQSAKNRAENLMIVDLLRNDLSKSCHNVRTPKLFELQSFANVHHLVSTVTGELNPDADALTLLGGSFPGGSITGAPKVRAMEIIEELEPVRRSVYCGSLGYLSADGNMDTSIAIRTLVCNQGRIYCWGGGGIVADSEPESEYEESWNKVRVLMETLEREFSDKA